MTLVTEQKHSRRLRAPSENRSAVVDPAWDNVADLVRDNIALRSQADYDFQGGKLSAISRQARLELLAAARRWTAAYRDVDLNPDNRPDLIFLAGHQPQMFHPGVWLKNFALGRLAEKHGAAAINLIVDSDAISTTSLSVPGGSANTPSVAIMPFDRPDPAVPYEERRIEDRTLFDTFGQRVQEQMAQLIRHPFIEKYWPLVIGQSRDTDRLGACIARARHLMETQWGINTLEVPQSWVCDLQSFHWLVAHVLAQLPKFWAIYNEAVQAYRHRYRIRSTSHPVPDLTIRDQWLEAPFWIWSKENPRRKRLFVKHVHGEVILTDRKDINERLPLSPEGDAARAVEQLDDLAHRGLKIRSRALMTTLWARLVLGDLFIHGIGGGNYDLVTDTIIERFFRRKPPGFMIVSATLHLPIKHIAKGDSPIFAAQKSGQSPAQKSGQSPTTIDRQLRELTYHPERFLNGVFDQSKAIPGEVQSLLDTKRKWIETPQTIENARTRCHAIRGINESLQPWLEDTRRQLFDLRVQAVKQQQAERILFWREYGFCLYPEETLRDFLDTLLPR